MARENTRHDTGMVFRDGPEDLDRAIRRLEWWHRRWEILNRDKIVSPTFATAHEVTHEHVWVVDEYSVGRGVLSDRCLDCKVHRAHVAGTPSAHEHFKRS